MLNCLIETLFDSSIPFDIGSCRWKDRDCLPEGICILGMGSVLQEFDVLQRRPLLRSVLL